MKYFILFLAVIFSLLSCSKQNAPECFRTAGDPVSKEFTVEPFQELIVFGRIDVYIEQGEVYEVRVESNSNLINLISAEVKAGQLILKNDISCNFFRDYNLTEIYVTVPNLTVLQNAGIGNIYSVGTLNFPELWIQAFDQEEIEEIYTVGNYYLDLISEDLRITSDNYSNFYLSGSAGYFDVYFAAGNGRLEAAELKAEIVDIQHRGTNTLIVNPQQVLKGEIRSTGDVISVNRPPIVEIETFYTGELIYKVP